MKRCKLCGKKLTGKRRKFCCNKHKDRYHNIHNPRGIFAHLSPDELDKEIDKLDDNEYYCATTHPLSSDALGQD